MNIFYLSKDQQTCARYHCDKHVVKMIVEYAQLLATAHRVCMTPNLPENLYKATHVNHPCAKWVRESRENYEWLIRLFFWLGDEYYGRYGKWHKTPTEQGHFLSQRPPNLPSSRFTAPPQCMPDVYKHRNTVHAYRRYYMGDKARFAKWNKGTPAPKWWKK